MLQLALALSSYDALQKIETSQCSNNCFALSCFVWTAFWHCCLACHQGNNTSFMPMATILWFLDVCCSVCGVAAITKQQPTNNDVEIVSQSSYSMLYMHFHTSKPFVVTEYIFFTKRNHKISPTHHPLHRNYYCFQKPLTREIRTSKREIQTISVKSRPYP